MQAQPEYLIELIDRASKNAGNDTRLAQELEVPKQTVSNWRHGRKPCPPADQALMANIAGLDAEAWGARALINQHAGTTKGAKLEAALKKALLVTGAAMLSSGAQAAPVISAAYDQTMYFIRCIFCIEENYRISGSHS